MAERYLLESSAVDGYQLEDASGVLLLESFPFVEEDDTWGGFAKNVVMGIAAAALTSTLLTASIGQQVANSDPADHVPGPPIEDFWQNLVAPVPPVIYQRLPYLPDAEEIPAGALLNAPGTTEDYWQVVQGQSAFHPLPFVDDDFLAAAATLSATEDYWVNPTYPVSASLYQRLPYLPDLEEVAAGSLFGQDDEDFWWGSLLGPPFPQERVLYQRLPYLPDPEEMPAGSLFGCPTEDYWQNPTAPAVGSLYQPLPLLPDVQDDPAGALSGQPDEDYWQNPVFPVQAANYQVLPYTADADDIPPVAASAIQDEDYWVNPVFPIQAVLYQELPYRADTDNIEFLATDEDYWISPVPVQIQQARNGPLLLWDSGEIAIPPVPLFDEDYWTSWVAPIPAQMYLAFPYDPDKQERPRGPIESADVFEISAQPLITMSISAKPLVEMDID